MHQYIRIFNQEMGTYPLLVGIGLFCIAFLVYRQLKRCHVPINTENAVMICIPFSVITGIAVGYFSDLLFRGGIKALAQPWGYGVTFYGWLSGTILFLWLYSRIVRLNLMFLLNCFLPTYSFAQGVGRIGCYLGGCCFGRPSTFWGVVYPPESLPTKIYGHTPLFPVQLVESGYLFLVGFVLFSVVKFSRRAGIYLILLSIGRFLLEYLRGDNRGMIAHLNMSPAQCLSILFFVLGVFLFIQSRRMIHNDHDIQGTDCYDKLDAKV